MKRVNKLAAAVALALSAGMAHQAQAIELKANARGDALLFPVYNNYLENYFTITNSDNNWVQGHIRFRGAAWSGELLDFDVILSPGDVFVFRLADIDGDGYWEIDQSIDPNNFRWSGMTQSCKNETTGAMMEQCMDQNPLLVPAASDNLPQAVIDHQRQFGYIEFIGEGVLLDNGVPPTHATMNQLADPAKAGQFHALGQRAVNSPSGPYGVSLWSWVAADSAGVIGDRAGGPAGYHTTRTAVDVPNSLSGNGFVTLAGSGDGLAYNADALVNFRTNSVRGTHRIENYPNTAVIIHHENSVSPAAGLSPVGDYVYGYKEEGQAGGRQDESMISFNNTWGPTMADGDDYTVTYCNTSFFTDEDIWDTAHTAGTNYRRANSICEVEEAINNYGSFFTTFYFDNSSFYGAELNSWFLGFFPTKFFYGEDPNYYSTTKLLGAGGYVDQAVQKLAGKSGVIKYAKPINVQIWDIEERPGTGVTTDCPQSPCLPGEIQSAALAFELNIFDVDWVKTFFPNAASFTRGWLGLEQTNAPQLAMTNPRAGNGYPMLGYTFDLESMNGKIDLGQWRSMHR